MSRFGGGLTRFISIFNNKGGVGKTTITWNLGHALGLQGKRVLAIDFDPQCNLSLAALGPAAFSNALAANQTIRSALQPFLQNLGMGPISTHKGLHSSPNLDLVAGDFWLNVYAESLSLGNDLLTGTGIAKYVVLRNLYQNISTASGVEYDYVLIDLPPSFGSLVRASLYSSDYVTIPCTSDTFSAYCVGLIGDMIPSFLQDWGNGVRRFKASNQGSTIYDSLGQPVFGGWIFNGYDTKYGRLVIADDAHRRGIISAVQNDLVIPLNGAGLQYAPIAPRLNAADYQIGGVEDMNVLVQNSLMSSYPVVELNRIKPIQRLQNKRRWAPGQIRLMQTVGTQYSNLASNVIGCLV